METNADITLIHSTGMATFNSEEIRAYGSLTELLASDVLSGIPDREKSLVQLWDAAESMAARKEKEEPEEREE